MTKRFGFTLAEVLITLGIIGVVAAMTIPTLMNQTGQAEFKTGFKKVISTLNQAITMNVALDNSDFSVLTGSATTAGTIYEMFNNRMNIVKTSAAVDATADVGATPDDVLIAPADNYALFFNDGMVVSFLKTAAACTVNTPCKALVDVNGTKKPNKLTKCSTTAADKDTTDCTSANIVIGDRFSIRFGGQQVVPNGKGARFVLYN